jgi:hypothetical protein
VNDVPPIDVEAGDNANHGACELYDLVWLNHTGDSAAFAPVVDEASANTMGLVRPKPSDQARQSRKCCVT